MKHKINYKCDICGENIVKCKNTCSCLPCRNKNQDCDDCFNDVFYCFSCKIKLKRNNEMNQLLLECREEKLKEIIEIEKKLKIYAFEKDIMFQ